MKSNSIRLMSFLFLVLIISASLAYSQTTEFTYQGSLKDGVVLANGNYDFEFLLFDALSGGTQQGSTLTRSPVAVSSGIFSVSLNFGSVFPGASRFLELRVRPTGGGAFNTLSPRQPIDSAPYSVRSLNASTADSVATGGIPAGSGNYIQNQNAAPQTSSNFNISGDGIVGGTLTGGIVNAATQFNIGGNRILSNAGASNLFAGVNAGAVNLSADNSFFGSFAGAANQTGTGNSFFGKESGKANTTGSDNSFFGRQAGVSNWVGSLNSFFGALSGANNSTGNKNAFFGNLSGYANTEGNENAFFGDHAGSNNTTASANSFFGKDAGGNNTTGTDNAFFGWKAGRVATSQSNSFFGATAGFNSSTGFENTFVGYAAAQSNTVGNANTAIGAYANVAYDYLTNATAIGHNALVSTSNSLVLGNGVNVGIGTSAPQYRLHVVGENVRVESNSPSIFPRFSLNFTGGDADAKRWQNYASTNALNFSALNDAETAETTWLQVNRGTGTAISSVLFPNGDVVVNGNTTTWGNVGIGSAPTIDRVNVNGTVALTNLGAGGFAALCWNLSNQISLCGSSIRYKQNISSFNSGLSLIRQLRPVSFNWRGNNQADLGLVAEEVNQVEPLLATTNDKGEVEGVKYDRISVVLVNAVKEQQAEIEEQRSQIDTLMQQVKEQKAEIEAFKALVCSQNPAAELCRPK